MRKLVYAINSTLDGFADHEAGIADEELHDFFTTMLHSTGALLYGRVVYELMASYWPTAADNPSSTHSEIEFANAINRIPKVCFFKNARKSRLG